MFSFIIEHTTLYHVPIKCHSFRQVISIHYQQGAFITCTCVKKGRRKINIVSWRIHLRNYKLKRKLTRNVFKKTNGVILKKEENITQG